MLERDSGPPGKTYALAWTFKELSVRGMLADLHVVTDATARLDPGFLPAEIAVGLAWDRSAVTLRADYWVLRSPDGVVARGRSAEFFVTAGEGGWVVLGAP